MALWLQVGIKRCVEHLEVHGEGRVRLPERIQARAAIGLRSAQRLQQPGKLFHLGHTFAPRSNFFTSVKLFHLGQTFSPRSHFSTLSKHVLKLKHVQIRFNFS
jgi:hypothetical protein